MWDPNGAESLEATLRNGEYDGRFARWDGVGGVHVASFSAGKPDGPFAHWHPNGAPNSCGGYRAGKKEGVFLQCQPSGYCQKRAEYHEDQLSGTSVEWDEVGRKLAETGNRDGKLDGPYTKWTREGNVEERGQYLAGQKSGRWVTWDSEGMAGQLVAQGRYERDRRVGVWKFFDDRGHLTAQGSYAWCESTPKLSVTNYSNGQKGYEGGPTPGCKKGRWSYWNAQGALSATADFDETDPRTWADPRTSPMSIGYNPTFPAARAKGER